MLAVCVCWVGWAMGFSSSSLFSGQVVSICFGCPISGGGCWLVCFDCSGEGDAKVLAVRGMSRMAVARERLAAMALIPPDSQLSGCHRVQISIRWVVPQEIINVPIRTSIQVRGRFFRWRMRYSRVMGMAREERAMMASELAWSAINSGFHE